ncbi:MAG: shikimate kinase [Myxococcota bacterium]
MSADLLVLGAEVRRERQRLGLSLRALAERSGLSERFVSDLERGKGNISIARLLDVAVALDVPLSVLVAPLDRPRQDQRQKRIALVGLRGAGKSTVGRRLAERLHRRFVELDQEIEAAAGLPLAQIFEIHGDDYYRRVERDVLRGVLEGQREVVIAAGGGLPSHQESWGLLRQRARTVWLKARPEEHYARVMEQGDLRPMKNRPQAMAELRALLSAREPYYGEAELVVDTSDLGLGGTVDEIAGWISPRVHSARVDS